MKIRKADIILIASLLAAAGIAAVIIMLVAKPGGSARLDYGDGQVLEIDLSQDNLYELESNGINIHILVKDGAAGFINSECPDHICEHYGMLSDSNNTAVCMPARAVLTIE